MAEKDYSKFKIVEADFYHDVNKEERKKRVAWRRKSRQIENQVRNKIAA